MKNWASQTSPRASHQLCFESSREKELVFVHKTVYEEEIHPSDELDGGRFWKIEEIKENLGKGIFTPNFEEELKKYLLFLLYPSNNLFRERTFFRDTTPAQRPFSSIINF